MKVRLLLLLFSLLAKISSVKNCAMHPGFSQCARVDVSRTCALSLHSHWKFWTFSNSVSEFSHVILNVSFNLWHRVVSEAFIVRYGVFWIVSTPTAWFNISLFVFLNLRSRFSPFSSALTRHVNVVLIAFVLSINDILSFNSRNCCKIISSQTSDAIESFLSKILAARAEFKTFASINLRVLSLAMLKHASRRLAL